MLSILLLSALSLSLGAYSLPQPTPTAPPIVRVAPALHARATTTVWSSVGCYSDAGSHALTATSLNYAGTDVEYCENWCQTRGFSLAGVRNGNQCACDNAIRNGNGVAAASACSLPCAGDSSETCGGGHYLNVYSARAIASTTTTTTATTTAAPSGSWSSAGCYSDAGSHALTATSLNYGGTDVEYCENWCQMRGFSIAGVRNGNQCACDNAIRNGNGPAAASACSLTCAGDSSEICGGGHYVNVYSFKTGTATTPTSTTMTTTSAPTTTAAPTGASTWSSVGCYTDGASHALTATSVNYGATDVEYCESWCQTRGYSVAGVKNGDQCFCDNAIRNNNAPAPTSSCTLACAGNNNEICGGGHFLNIYQYVATGATSTTTTTSASPSSTGWANLGCRVDSDSRALTGPMQQVSTNTVESCEQFCSSQGYIYAGVEYGSQCFCGNTLANGAGGTTASSDCNMACAGNSAETCGGSYRLNLYSHIGATASATSTTMTSTSSAATSTSSGSSTT
ncbi:WSC-domain-containing protein, partial [Calocera cornea HHB12733]